MSYWYYDNNQPVWGERYISKVYSNTYVFPFVLGGVQSTYKNKSRQVVVQRITSGQYAGNFANITAYTDTSNVLIYKGISVPFNWYGPTRMFVSDNNLKSLDPYLTELPATTISGRFRFKSNILSSYGVGLSSTCYPLSVDINGEKYDYIWFTGNVEWAGSSVGNVPPTGGNGVAVFNSFGEVGTTPDYTLITQAINDSTLKDKYFGMIWDFGVTPQETTQAFMTWLLKSADPIYPYTFTVKGQNGENVLASLNEAPAMVDATASVIGNVKTLTMTGANGQTYTMTWESETPAGKQFLGLAYGANETRASIPVGRTTPVTWDGSLTIYEAYGTYRPPVTTFDINLYQSSAEVNRVDKTDFLTGIGTLSGVLREECSIIAPSITFKQTTVPTFNYVYIAAFGRYYYVTGITSVSKDVWRMSLSCDVLMTWKDNIRALTAIIARQENTFNPLLLDSELPAQANQNITVTEFPAGGFSTDVAIEHPFVLTVVGA